MAGTILRLGWTDPRTDAFGAHPLLGDVVDLNDGVTFTLLDGALELDPPTRELALAGNPRAQGERAIRALYRHNRQARAQLSLGPMASAADLAANVRALVRWLDAAPTTPICVQWQPPSAAAPVYLDVVGAAHSIPTDERDWLRLQLEPVEIILLVRPGLRGDRVTLQNLVVNPGFETGSGPTIQVFNDTFANTDAYAVHAGSAPTVAANVMTIPAGARVSFGSPTWGAINQWALRFQANGDSLQFFRDYVDGSNFLMAQYYAPSTSWTIQHNVAGTTSVLAGPTTAALTTGSWYWLTLAQFPSAPGAAPDVQVTIYSDNGGTLGAQMVALGPIAAASASVAISGQPQIAASSVALQVGGAYGGVHTVALFGPGAWGFTGVNGTLGVCSGAWEQDPANTYGGGPVVSFGALRMDCPPSGTVGGYWNNYLGGSPTGALGAIPAAEGQTLGVSVWLRSAGVGASMSQQVRLYEYDASGAQLRASTLATLTGAQALWTQLAATLTLGASTAYVGLLLLATDTTAGASAGGVIWWDNCQVYNQTTTGATSMPYCELRFDQSPAQLLVTGLLGDLPAPAHVAWGTYLPSWATGATLSYALGRRAQASARARLAGPSHGFYGTALSPTSTAIRDTASYGGYYASASVNPGWNPRAFSFPPSDLLGVYHLFSRFWTSQVAGNLANVQVRVVTQQKSNPWYGTLGDADQLGAYNGPYSAPLAAANTWTVVDAGQVNVPALPAGALTDLTQNFLTPRPQWQDITSGGSMCRSNWQLLLPIDGSLLVGLANNPSNGAFAVATSWLWAYYDGLLVNRAAVGDAAALTYSLESAPTPNPARGAGGPGTSSTGAINLNGGADPYLTLDPSVAVTAVSGATGAATGGSGVNQLAGYVADNNAATLPLFVEIQYSPLYLYPR